MSKQFMKALKSEQMRIARELVMDGKTEDAVLAQQMAAEALLEAIEEELQ